MNIDISVITICFNSEECIARTLESVFSQTHCRFEYIIKDGGSCDKTLEIIEQIKKQSNINIPHVVVSEKDGGVYDAMNCAVSMAQGKWVIFMNAGDTFGDEKVLAQARHILEETNRDIVYGNAIMRDVSGDTLFLGDLSLINKRMPFCHQAVFTRRSLLLEHPFSSKYKIVADYDFFAWAYHSGKQFHFINSVIAIYTIDGLSSTKFVPKLFEQEDIYCKYGFKQHKYGGVFVFKLAEALIKKGILTILPLSMQQGLRRFYALKIKKYKALQ